MKLNLRGTCATEAGPFTENQHRPLKCEQWNQSANTLPTMGRMGEIAFCSTGLRMNEVIMGFWRITSVRTRTNGAALKKLRALPPIILHHWLVKHWWTSQSCVLSTLASFAAKPHFLIEGGNKNKSIKTKLICFCQWVGKQSSVVPLPERKQCCLKFAASFWQAAPWRMKNTALLLSESTVQSCEYRRRRIGISWFLTIPFFAWERPGSAVRPALW